MAARLVPPPGTRFPLEGDESQAFLLGPGLEGHLTFAELLGFHDPASDAYTLLLEVKSMIVGAACLVLTETAVKVDYIARNFAFSDRGVQVGTTLLQAIEAAAKAWGAQTIRLDSLEDPELLAWYGRRGFAAGGEPFIDATFGWVRPLVKRVGPL